MYTSIAAHSLVPRPGNEAKLHTEAQYSAYSKGFLLGTGQIPHPVGGAMGVIYHDDI